ncbi:GNAT family N-acetyltransferase [Neorhizobium galegae]|uniref:GNAT family N-acetyltransferase n=1 Tax=Neorhizobium galegae TaxID=399 RepID=UPI000621E576|nr:GNAT family N-acetyltransferase [Neorhizobium galegae]MCQ1851533.1 GNAT family N-acetyltransferase [Neorhizobium galegae]CDZ43631.1 Acetyltransferase [Neorhizobium galegae bv. orientalis]
MNIRFFQPADAEELACLFEEMQAYYGVFCPPRQAILSGILNRPPQTEFLVAETDRIIAAAAFAAIYPGPGLQPGFFLKELYVAGSERGRDIGTALMKRLAGLAVERGFGRIDWTAARANERLLKFYDELGGDRKEDRIFYRLEGPKLKALAGLE